MYDTATSMVLLATEVMDIAVNRQSTYVVARFAL